MADATRPSLTREACAKLGDYLEGPDILIWEHEAWKDDDWSKLTPKELATVDEYFQILDDLMEKIVFPGLIDRAVKDGLPEDDNAVAQAVLLLKLPLFFAAAKAGDYAPWLLNVLNQDTQES